MSLFRQRMDFREPRDHSPALLLALAASMAVNVYLAVKLIDCRHHQRVRIVALREVPGP